MSGVYVVCTTSNNKIEVNWHEDAKLKCDVSDFYYVNDICLILWIFNRITSFFPLSLTHEIVADQLTRAYQTQCPCGCRPFVTHQRLSRCGLRLNWTMVKANRKQTTNVWWWNWIVCTPRRCGEYSYQWNLPKCIHFVDALNELVYVVVYRPPKMIRS